MLVPSWPSQSFQTLSMEKDRLKWGKAGHLAN